MGLQLRKCTPLLTPDSTNYLQVAPAPAFPLQTIRPTMHPQPLLVKHWGKLLLVGVASSAFYASFASSAFSANSDRYTPYWRPNAKRCDPYEQLGFLSYSGSQYPHESRWMPYRDECHSPALFASLMRSAWGITPNTTETFMPRDWWKEEAGPDGRPWEDVEWAHGKTVLYVGDSIGRENVQYFCQVSSFRSDRDDRELDPPTPTACWPRSRGSRAGARMATRSRGP